MNPKLLLAITAFIFGGLTIASNEERNEETRYRNKTQKVRDKYKNRSQKLDAEYNRYKKRFI